MGKKAILFIIIGAVLGVALAGGGIFFILSNAPKEVPEGEEVEEVIEEYDKTQGKRLKLEKVQVPLAYVSSKQSYLVADFTVVFKTEDALTKANDLQDDIKAAIYSVFETKTADELRSKPATYDEFGNKLTEATSPRDAMCKPVLEAIKNIYFTEEDKENVVDVVISSFMIG